MMNNIKFEIDTGKVLSLLSNEIYDSPYALLRENVQNAYDAILMRQQKESFSPLIQVTIENNIITIEDNGVGMTAETVENNYWKAGSSGKNNEEAKNAGVVGTFGIGAMANFGICTRLQVETHHMGGDKTIISFANRNELKIGEKCINTEERTENKEPGTKVIATVDDSGILNVGQAKEYLRQYAQYLSIPVRFNGELISQNSYYHPELYIKDYVKEGTISTPVFSCSYKIFVANYNEGRVVVYADKITIGDSTIKGDIFLEQNRAGSTMGLRNGFGLAEVPLQSFFGFTGIVNLTYLVPTAGRDSLNRESVDMVGKIIVQLEENAALYLSELDICDNNKAFLNYVFSKRRFELASKIQISTSESNEFLRLGELASSMNGRNVYYYTGSDKSVILQYTNENTILLITSKDYPRHNIQMEMLNRKGITPVPDHPRVTKRFDHLDLSSGEFAFILRITTTLKEDYFLPDVKVNLAEISHGVSILVQKDGANLLIDIARNSENVANVVRIYEQDIRLFDGFVKDYVRSYLYQQVSSYVPSSTRQGADALYRMLLKNRELYTIDTDEKGEIESLMAKYIAGEVKFEEVIKQTVATGTRQQQKVSTQQIGQVENELSRLNLVEGGQGQAEKPVVNPGIAMPPIKMVDSKTSMKILRADGEYPQLNNHKLFLALSDRLFERQREFFLDPHITRVIWGAHKILYIFTHASGRLTLYYEIEMKHKLVGDSTGGRTVPTSTLIFQNRVFIPVIPELEESFEMTQSSISFYVRFDLISDFEE